MLLKKHAKYSSLETALGNKRTSCFINSKFY